ncbi:MAG: KH domain-containing protein [Candidatus Diapherotrites archaeon]|nr:KH domain-containing protein [Candidatus Diapherotrites archaeon]
MEEIVRIPHNRIGVLIGPKGEIKKTISQKTQTTMEIDSASGEVAITGDGENFFKATDIVKAIGRGFSPARAFALLKDDYLLRIIEIPEFVGKNASKQKARRGRVIGKGGLARTQIEKKTRSLISVQGKTVAIIARDTDIELAEGAVEILLEGARHETATKFIDRAQRERFEL